MEINEIFSEVLKNANEIITSGYSTDDDLDRAEKLIGHCALYFSTKEGDVARPENNEFKFHGTMEEFKKCLPELYEKFFKDEKDGSNEN